MGRDKSFAAKVRTSAQRLQKFTIGDIVYDLSPGKYLSPQPVDWTLKDMIKRGEVEREGAKFRYKQAPLPAVSDRVYRAMHVRGCFNTTDIVMLSDADRSYVNTVIRRLVKAGHLAFAGWKPGVDGKQVRMLRVVHRDKFYLEFCR